MSSLDPKCGQRKYKLFPSLKILAKKLTLKISTHIFDVPRWLNIDQACRYADIKRDTMMEWIDRGYIYAHERSGEWIVDRESIDSFYNQDN